MQRTIPLTLSALCASATMLNAVAWADPVAVSATRPDEWQFAAYIYGWYPTVGSKVTFPNGQSSDATVDASDLLNNLKFAMIGAFEVRKGSWGMFTDVMYMDVGKFQSRTHDLTIGKVGLPADVSASANFDLKTTIWTLAATYQVMADKNAPLGVFAGARLLDLKESLDWTLNGNIGQFPLPGRAGTQSAKDHNIDGIVGLKGRVAFGKDLKWFVPYYGDIGTGNSQVTWQAMAGLGYAFHWGEIIGGWRYLDYQFKSDSKIDSMSMNGPMLGVAFVW